MSDIQSFGSSSHEERMPQISRVRYPAPIHEYQHRLIARTVTNTSSDIFEMEVKSFRKKTGQMSSVWEVSQATSRTISDSTYTLLTLLIS